MRRILVLITILILSLCGYLYYQDHQNSDQYNQKVFDQVMSEKMETLYLQARNWKTPLNMEVKDNRLDGDYQVMSEFILSYWMDNIEARNRYLRQLDRANWDHFLSPARFEQDRKNGYLETTQMLSAVEKSTAEYQAKRNDIIEQAIQKVETLSINKKMRASMKEKLKLTRENSDEIALLQIEMEILKKAKEMFSMLKTYKWQNQNDTFMFAHDAQVRQFNILYAEVVEFQHQIDELKKQNARVFETDE